MICCRPSKKTMCRNLTIDFNYQSLIEWIRKLSPNGQLLVPGVFNGRVHTRFVTEDHRLGDSSLTRAMTGVESPTFAWIPWSSGSVSLVTLSVLNRQIGRSFGQIDVMFANKDYVTYITGLGLMHRHGRGIASMQFPIIVQLDIALLDQVGHPEFINLM